MGRARRWYRSPATTSGSYSYHYTPRAAGNWTVVASYAGDDRHIASRSDPAVFNMEPQQTAIWCSLVSTSVKVDQPVELVGGTVPQIQGLSVEALLTSNGESKTVQLTTGQDGSFRLSEPLPEGNWEIVTQVKGNWRFSSSSSGIVSAIVVPLSLIDKAVATLSLMASPPYIYMLVLTSGIFVALVVRWKSASIAAKVPEPIRGLLMKFGGPKGEKKRENVTGRQRYKRQSENS